MTYELLLSILPLILLGVGMGVVGGLLGIGGGLIAIPVLVHFFGMEQQLAQGTALVMIAPNVLVAFYRYRQKHHIGWASVASMAVFSMVSTYFAARFATGMDPRQLQIGFGVFLLVLALYFGGDYLHKSRRLKTRAGQDILPAQQAGQSAAPKKALPLMAVASGLMSGLFTIGGGLVVVPALVTGFSMTQARAQGMALALVVPGSFVALATYGQAGNIDWSTGLPLACGGVFSVSWGVKLAHRFSAARMRFLFCAVLIATAVAMLW